MASPFPVHLQRDDHVWSVSLDGARYWTEWGKVGGKIQRRERLVKAGKQGRDAQSQARLEAMSLATKKRAAGYVDSNREDGTCQGDTPHPPLPMLATDWSKVTDKAKLTRGIMVQPKLDGIRCVADTQTGRLYSRTGKVISGLVHIEHALRLAADVATPPATWMDGELYRHGMSFQGIVGAARRSVNVDVGTAERVQLHLFDMVTDAACESRLSQLATWLTSAQALVSPGKLDSLQLVHTEDCGESAGAECVERTVKEAVDRFVADGYEGAIIRCYHSPYTVRKRSQDLIKFKRFFQEEFPMCGIEERAKQPGVAAAIRCKTHAGVSFKATPQCSEDEKKEMWAGRKRYSDGTWVATVRYQEMTDAKVPRFPVCVGLRHVDDCGTSLS